MLTIDLHGHFVVRELLRSQSQTDPWRYETRRRDNGELYLCREDDIVPLLYEAMDVPGIVKNLDLLRLDIMALSIIPPQMSYRLDAGIGLAASRVANDAIASAVAAYPKRFVGLGVLPLQNVEYSLEELDRIMGELEMKGVQLGSNVDGIYLGDDRFRPLWAAIHDFEALVVVHPVNLIGADRLRPYFLSNLIGNPVETTRCIADIVFSGLLDAFPRLKICFAHGGGVVASLLGRWDHGYAKRPQHAERINRPPSEYARMLYYDMITHSAEALECLTRQVGIDHIVIGTDYPFDMGPTDPLGFVEGLEGLTGDAKLQIAGGTAARLLGLS
jgi:aminocarboxymuconate-semialdehyde decarboxylase